MKIVFITNAYDHTTGPLCDELFDYYGKDFIFIATGELSGDRKGIGLETQRSYVLNANANRAEALKLCDDADVLIFGFAPFEYIKNRVKKNKLTIYYSERLFKRNLLRYLNPITLSNLYKNYIKPSKNSNFHLICASSFAALDYARIGAFKNKMYKWGYQPTIYEKNIDETLDNKAKDGQEFIWVGRLVKLKHCDDAIRVIANLKNQGYQPRMTVIGSGPQEQELKELTKKLNVEDSVIFKGVCLIEETRALMDTANIFMFTSDFGEGWGVTLNECMNSGVACVASHGAGATNFLVKDKENALLYVSGDVDMLTEKVKQLIDNKDLRENIGRNAYSSMVNLWNPKKSSKRMIEFISEIQKKGKCELYTDGPLSKALPLSHNWYKR